MFTIESFMSWMCRSFLWNSVHFQINGAHSQCHHLHFLYMRCVSYLSIVSLILLHQDSRKHDLMLKLVAGDQCLIVCVVFCRSLCSSLCPFFGQCIVCPCIVCPSVIDGIWLPLWYLQIFRMSIDEYENEIRKIIWNHQK
jgi:hypothetical protein